MSNDWPNFFLAGPGRAGSTTLYNILRKIPGMYFPAMKEPGYFSHGLEAHRMLYQNKQLASDHKCTSDASCIKFIKHSSSVHSIAMERNGYLSLYDGAGNTQIRGDASITYFFNPYSRRMIHEVSPRAKILVILRDPVDRVLSGYGRTVVLRSLGIQRMKSLREHIDIHLNPHTEQSIMGWDASGYSSHLRDWMGLFGRPNVKVIVFEEFVKDQHRTVRDILKWLGLDAAKADFEPRHDNASMLPRIPLLFGVWSRCTEKRADAATYDRMLNSYAEYTSGSIVRSIYACRRSVLSHIRKLAEYALLKPGRQEAGSEDRVFLCDLFRDDVREIEGILGRRMPWKNFA